MGRILQVQARRGTAATWTSTNPTLASGEMGLETDTGLIKFGDGATAWTALPYVNPGNQKIVPPAPNTATPATIGATEVVVKQVSIAANTAQVGTTIKFFAAGTISGTTPSLLPKVRLGTAGTIGDTQVAATVAAVMTSATGWQVQGFLTIRSIGSGGTAIGEVRTFGEALATANRVSAQTATVAVNTTVANTASLTLIGGGTSPVITVTMAYIEIARQ